MTSPKILVLLASCWALAIAAIAGPANLPLAGQNPATASPGKTNFSELSEAADKAREENRDDDAIRLYRQALGLQPSWKQGLWFLGMLLYDKDQYSEVRDLMRRFVA
ncbi:MAG TPA: hypothetical protein VMU05_17060, partial [Dongiaceae bacterium]|nr:hypothetical protein [Dongiaceae bacterium]